MGDLEKGMLSDTDGLKGELLMLPDGAKRLELRLAIVFWLIVALPILSIVGLLGLLGWWLWLLLGR